MRNLIPSGMSFLPGLFLVAALVGLNGFVPDQPIPPRVESCTPPAAFITARGAGTITFGWSPVTNAQSYRVWYVRVEDNYQSGVMITTNTYITFSGLPSGTYHFYFVTDCGIYGLSVEYILDDIYI